MTSPNITRRNLLKTSIATGIAGSISPFAIGQESSPFTVGVIGHTGRGNYGHGIDKVWLGIPETKIIGVSDPDEKGRTKALETLSLSKDQSYADYHEMLKALSPDIVAIGPRYVDEHRDMAVAAANAGAKGIYIEKPFCRTPAEADDIVSACKESGTKLAIAHRNRYHPVLPVVKQLVEEGEIGEWLEVRCRGKEDARGGGLDLWVLGSHILNLIHYYCGAPKACYASLYQDGKLVTKDDVYDGGEGVGPLAANEIHARYEMENSIPVYFDSKKEAGTREAGFGFQLIGTEGIIDFRMDAEPLAHICKGSPFRPASSPREWVPITTAGIGKPEPIEDIRKQVGGHVAPATDILDAIREDRPTLCSAEDGRVVVEMTMAVFESHRLGGARVDWPLKNRDNPLTRL
ncbi:MAG: 3-chlorobenzoate-3,4-dioxygenase [Verrucomicrobiales bacterium]|nr:3-chlorobenzoate-3,4-dioxygenase [Verrucomicrobiales bacterium]